MRSSLDLMPRTLCNWELSFWDFQGVQVAWNTQLIEMYRKEPVFALTSELSNTTWASVDAFCQQEKLPCFS
jgi:hypothetical protein